MFDNKEYIKQKQALENSKIELVDKEYKMYKNWKESLDIFISQLETKYLLINDCIYIKVENTCSGVIPNGNHSVISWYRLFGLTIYDDDLNLINSSFSGLYTVNLTDSIKVITKEEFDTKFKERCDIVFVDTEQNFDIQYKNYISRFEECILEKFSNMFPKHVHDFVQRLEEKADKELSRNIF